MNIGSIRVAWSTWNTFDSCMAFVTFSAGIAAWCFFRTATGRRWKLNRTVAELFYSNRELFVDTDCNFSIPTFLRSGHHHQEGMTLREWSYFALSKPILFPKHDAWLQYVSIMNTARHLIKQTMDDPKDQSFAKIYEQLEPRFNKLCAAMNDMRTQFAECPIQLQQAYLPALRNIAEEVSSAGRTR